MTDYIPKGQFFITQNELPNAAEGQCFRFFDHYIYSNYSGNRISIKDNNNTEIGVIIGFLLDVDNLADNNILNLSGFSKRKGSLKDHFENAIYSFSGRFIALLRDDKNTFVYLDPSGSMPAIYSQKYGHIVSSPEFLPNFNHEENFNFHLFKKVKMPESGLWFPGQLTAYHHYKRLLPNFSLNLNTWEVSRHWPETEHETSKKDAELIQNISSQLYKTMEFLHVNHKISLPITAGEDSRMLLSACEPFKNDIDLFTLTHFVESKDEHIACKMAEDYNLNWKKIHFTKASDLLKEEWLRRVAYAVSGAIWEKHPSLEKVNPEGVITSALCGEVGRAFLWKKEDKTNTPLTAEDLLGRMGLPPIPEFKQAAKQWISSLPDVDTFTKLDLAYIELRSGCWGSPQLYGNLVYAEHVYLFSNRKIFQSMLALSPHVKKEKKFSQNIIATRWPALNDYPFNAYTGLSKIKDLYFKSKLIPNYIRKRLIK